MIRLLPLCLIFLAAVLCGAEDKSKTIPPFNFDRELPRNATDKAEAQAAADEMLTWALLNRRRSIIMECKHKADKDKLAELKAIKGLPKSEADFNQRIIDSLKVEVDKCDAAAKEHASLAVDQRAQAERLLAWAEIPHDPITPYTGPDKGRVDPGTLSEQMRWTDTDRDIAIDAKKSPQAQAQALRVSADEDDRLWLIAFTESAKISVNPGNGVSPSPDFGPAWRVGTPESTAQSERNKSLVKRCNYLSWVAQEKRRQAKALLANPVMADTHP